MFMICLCQISNILNIQIADNCRQEVVLNVMHCYRLCENRWMDRVARPINVVVCMPSIHLLLVTGVFWRGEEQEVKKDTGDCRACWCYSYRAAWEKPLQSRH